MLRVQARPIEALRSFIKDEEGALPITTGYLVMTMAGSIPLGFALYSLYEGLYRAGWFASFMVGMY